MGSVEDHNGSGALYPQLRRARTASDYMQLTSGSFCAILQMLTLAAASILQDSTSEHDSQSSVSHKTITSLSSHSH